MKIESNKIQQIYSYLRNETAFSKSDGIFAFCRKDPLVAERAAEIYDNCFADYIMFTGGIGKDSGYLTELQVPEAKWQAMLTHEFHNIPTTSIYVEPNATNGGDCCRFGIDTIVKNNLPHEDLIMLVHPTSIRRTQAVLELEAEKKGFKTEFKRTGTHYKFDSRDPIDQKEAIAELLRLADWPAKGWCKEQTDLPQDLVQSARDIFKP